MKTLSDSTPHILIVDDDAELCEMIGRYLEAEGFRVDAQYDGIAGMNAITEFDYDVIILDVMMPKLNGIEALREIRKMSETPVLMLTARGEDIDRIIGLEVGADDYLPKPCNPRELVARLRAILRRTLGRSSIPTNTSAPGRIEVDDILLELGSQTVKCNDKPLALALTGAEFTVLELLIRSAGQMVTKDQLTLHALGRKLSPYDRSIDTHIANLRKKLGPATDGALRIKTVRGKGYLYVLR